MTARVRLTEEGELFAYCDACGATHVFMDGETIITAAEMFLLHEDCHAPIAVGVDEDLRLR